MVRTCMGWSHGAPCWARANRPQAHALPRPHWAPHGLMVGNRAEGLLLPGLAAQGKRIPAAVGAWLQSLRARCGETCASVLRVPLDAEQGRAAGPFNVGRMWQGELSLLPLGFLLGVKAARTRSPAPRSSSCLGAGAGAEMCKLVLAGRLFFPRQAQLHPSLPPLAPELQAKRHPARPACSSSRQTRAEAGPPGLVLGICTGGRISPRV